MRVLFWSPYFAPELTGIAPLVTDAADWLSRSHDVAVVTSLPNYPERRIAPAYRGSVWRGERRGDVLVQRSWLWVRPGEGVRDKMLHELTFATLSAPLVARRLARADVLVCVVPSLTAACYAGPLRAAASLFRRRRLVLWVQDLVLLAAFSLDAVGEAERRLLRAAELGERLACRAADCVVVCSPGFASYLEERGVDPARIVTVLNGVDTEAVAVGEPPPAGGPTRFLYAGNLGYTQGFETLVEAAKRLDGQVEVDIVGDGNAAEHVHRLAAPASNVRVLPPVSWPEFPRLLASAHVLVVIQRGVSAGANLPSKIAPYLASGRPVVASLDLETPAARLLAASGGALLVPAEDPVRLAAEMARLHEDAALRDRLGRSGRQFALERLGRERTLGRLEQAILG